MNRFACRNSIDIPESFYNIKADLETLPKPPLHPGTQQPLRPEDLEALFPKEFVGQSGTVERHVPIPEEVREAFSVFRPTPLAHATALERALETPARIFYKYEGVGPCGSHKSNTAIMQAYLAAKEGIEVLTTETGAGQWGSALAHAGSVFGVRVRVFMVRVSFRQKPGRRILMELFGATVAQSPSALTESGRHFLELDAEHPGSLGIAISEAVESAVKDPRAKYSLGSVLDGVLLHQTVIGLEAEKQLIEFGAEPEIIIGCVGGGSNFSGLSFPFIGRDIREKKKTRYIAVEPEVCPTITRGEMRYDHGDSVGLAPLLFMHTLGMEFVPPSIHAGGLRYHGMAPLVSHLVDRGVVEARAYSQDVVFDAARRVFKAEGILPAPESAVIDEALMAKKKGKETVILFNLSGHGFLDISAYDGLTMPGARVSPVR